MELKLFRVTLNKLKPQIGLLIYEEIPALITLELPNLDNQHLISCIPEGEYLCKETKSEKANGRTFEVTDVPNRTGILFHPGNTIKDTHGCILTGLELGFINGEYGIRQSKAAFMKFLSLTKDVKEFNLSIKSIY